ncbi:hypothetical protein PUNSTDRAFT_103395 [Punctularia strigosozonata HHB-11173 SS5]|uniref:uncharacterized protein n=1 Tax=Punctularia strigosozonata (strain HHB-11173) TaxID=741275 RepID=UPI0004416672|nr:uncharacterized protein PUNSTDRAFT_103395 [Punctularia strigosozonata HHB-11173 SS5]EIN08521.1 hypothetical protein PUNSTDRAFT_103395 [Punctularia strigosozonata HHB-11173 SS5]
MFVKSLITLVSVLAVTSQVSAHAAIAPALGVSGTPVRNDVQRPSTNSPCGNVDIASTLDTSTPVQAAADGTFTATISNFNAGQDGSRQVTAQVDATGAGNSFKAATVSQNGDLAPTDVGSQQLVVSLPANTACTGGKAGNLCLASFTTAGGFGNCVVVAQAGAAAAAGNNTVAATGSAAAAAATTAAAATGNATTTGKHHHHKGNATAGAAGAAAAAPNPKRALALRFARHLRERN